MASLMETLIEVLENENLEYKNLLDLSMKKTPAIVSDNIKALAEITDEEQIIVSRINHLDPKRSCIPWVEVTAMPPRPRRVLTIS